MPVKIYDLIVDFAQSRGTYRYPVIINNNDYSVPVAFLEKYLEVNFSLA